MHQTILLAAALIIGGTTSAFAEGDAAKGEAVFKRCSACHAVGEGAKNKVGPVLNGIVGRPAGSIEGYNYSAAMKTAAEGGLTWTTEELKDFLANPRKKIPGNKMASPGINKPDDLDNLLAYLNGFKAAE